MVLINGNFPQPIGSFRKPVAPPSTEPTDGEMITVCFSKDWLPYVLGALTQLTLQATWKTDDNEETMLAQRRAASLIDLIAIPENSCVFTAPYWDENDGADANGDDVETGFPWYEDVSDWIVTAFLATTFTPEAAIQFVTTARKIRLWFRTRDYGAIANIFLDDEIIWQQDTFSESPSMVQFAYDILDDEPTHTLRVVHSGEASPAAMAMLRSSSSSEYGIDVIRKRLDWGSSVFGGGGTGNPEDTDIRYDPVTDTFQQTIDGGETWQSAPWADPRNQNQFPPPDTPDPMCDAAARMVGALQQAGLGYVNELHAAASVYALASVPMAILGAFFGFGLLLPAAVVGANALVTAGHDAVKAAYEAIDWEALQCQLYCSLASNGVLDDAGFFELQSYVNTLPFGQQMILNSVLNLSGRGGLNNLASTRTETGVCECACCTVVVGANVGGNGVNSETSVTLGVPVDIISTGTWKINTSMAPCGADGSTALGPAGAGYRVPGALLACLVGRIGTTGSWFALGENVTFTPLSSGVLYLGVNESPAGAGYSDNTGSLTVTIIGGTC